MWAQIVSWAPIHARDFFIVLGPGKIGKERQKNGRNIRCIISVGLKVEDVTRNEQNKIQKYSGDTKWWERTEKNGMKNERRK